MPEPGPDASKPTSTETRGDAGTNDAAEEPYEACWTSDTTVCNGITGTDSFTGQAYHAYCSGSWIQERCTLRGTIYCCPYW